MNQIATSRSDWANKIAVMWGQSRDSMIEVGKLLIASKAALGHGKFAAMCACDLPFSQATANRLMAIARHDLLPGKIREICPVDVTSLYELSRLTPQQLAAAVAEGNVSPDMGTGEIRRLVGRIRGTKSKSLKADILRHQTSRCYTTNGMPLATVSKEALIAELDVLPKFARFLQMLIAEMPDRGSVAQYISPELFNELLEKAYGR